MNVRPLHDRVIVRRLEEGEQKVGGIIIPDTAKEKPMQGKVLAVGNGKSTEDGTRVPLDVKVGDLILFGRYSGQEIKVDGEEFLIMKEDEVLGVIEHRSPSQATTNPSKSTTSPSKPVASRSAAKAKPVTVRGRANTKGRRK